MRQTLRMPFISRSAWILLLVPLLVANPAGVTTRAAGPQVAAPEAKKSQEKAEKKPDVIFVPTPQEVVDKMLELAELKKGDVLYDLGCGDGRIVVTAAKKYGVKADRLRHRPPADQGVPRERPRRTAWATS